MYLYELKFVTFFVIIFGPLFLRSPLWDQRSFPLSRLKYWSLFPERLKFYGQKIYSSCNLSPYQMLLPLSIPSV
jgi:hypothetical protein